MFEVNISKELTYNASPFAASMALMDAGIPLREHVAGVSVGLVSEVDPSTGIIKDYRIVTDILVRFPCDLSYLLLHSGCKKNILYDAFS